MMMWFLIAVQLFVIVLLFMIGWAIRNMKTYWMISGFENRSKEEQQQLIQNGLPQKIGSLLITTAVGMVVLLPLLFTSFKYAIEVQFGFMIVFLLGGLIYLSKYEIPKKRKRSYLINSVLFVVVIGFISATMFLGYQDHKLIPKNDSFEITGMYGDEWKYQDILRVELMEEMPEVTWKQNGFGLSTMAKGYFKVKEYGSSLLFIHKNSSPYLYIELKNKKIFVNGHDSKQTRYWYEQLRKNIK
jgi:hypothetical protein